MSVEVLDLAGRRVETLILPAGSRQVVWDGRDEHGRPCAPGVYFVRPAGGGGRGQKVQRLR
jgi:hypothetical protein